MVENQVQMNQDHEKLPEAKKKSGWIEILDWVKSLLIAILIGFLLTAFVIQRNEVSGNSMYSTLHNGDQVLVEKISKLWQPFQKNEIVTIQGQDIPYLHGELQEALVKRIVGVPGDEIQIKNGQVYINGVLQQENYISKDQLTEPLNPIFSHIKLKEDEYYVLGDNRTRSRDSRDFGPVPKRAIMGVVWVRIYPFDRFGTVK